MPFPMIHLLIAEKVLSRLHVCRNDYSQYYLGTLAPDSVHFREGYTSALKIISHLYHGSGTWGNINDNPLWITSAADFYRNRNKSGLSSAFVAGYCLHILSDIYNNIRVWTPFKKAYPEEYAKGGSNRYHLENWPADVYLHQTTGLPSRIFALLKKSVPQNIDGIITVIDTEIQLDRILYRQYACQAPKSVAGNTLITHKFMADFIDVASEFATDILLSVDNNKPELYDLAYNKTVSLPPLI